jgi:hypothetical protein
LLEFSPAIPAFPVKQPVGCVEGKMRKELITTLALALAASTAGMAQNEIPVQVYLQPGNWPDPPLRSEKIASAVFARIGVKLLWRIGPMPDAPGSGTMVGIRFVEKAPITASSHALAGAPPFSSHPQILVYQDRLRRHLNAMAGTSHVMLAYVLAHELCHIMQGTNRHSDSGLMRASWTGPEYAAMLNNSLFFSDDDRNLILAGLAVYPRL